MHPEEEIQARVAAQATKPFPVVQTPRPEGTPPRPRWLFPAGEWAIIIPLTLIALIPRVLLALQLDISTDEPIYILASNWYILLFRQLNITSTNWLYNNEHPAFAKLLMGLSIHTFQYLHPANQLFPARVPSVLLGTLMIVAVYILGKNAFGRAVALVAALSLALSPWMAYFSSEALLDMTMTTCITLACLCLWHAIRRPRLYALTGILIGLAGASKYPAALVVPGMLLFVAYYYGILRRALPASARPSLPWRWWLIGLCLIPVSFFLADPPIWADPVHRLITSLQFSLGHADTGHVTFWAGQTVEHVPAWMIFYVVFAKVSAFVTLPALFFAVFAAIQLIRFHWPRQTFQRPQPPAARVNKVAALAFLWLWLINGFICFGQLNILVGTHYYLPIAPPLFLAGTTGLAIVVRALFRRLLPARASQPASQSGGVRTRPAFDWRVALVLAILALVVVGPHLIGLLTVADADGYTNEFFHGANSSLEVTYDGYRDADTWLLAHSKSGGTVGVVGGPATGLWYMANPQKMDKLQFDVVQYGSKRFNFDYLIWPENLIQRGWAPSAAWQAHLVHIISGGNTTYCLIMARDPSSLTAG